MHDEPVTAGLAAVVELAGLSAQFVPAIVGICALLAAVLPSATEASSPLWQRLRRALDLLAGNFKNARNQQ